MTERFGDEVDCRSPQSRPKSQTNPLGLELTVRRVYGRTNPMRSYINSQRRRGGLARLLGADAQQPAQLALVGAQLA